MNTLKSNGVFVFALFGHMKVFDSSIDRTGVTWLLTHDCSAWHSPTTKKKEQQTIDQRNKNIEEFDMDIEVMRESNPCSKTVF